MHVGGGRGGPPGQCGRRQGGACARTAVPRWGGVALPLPAGNHPNEGAQGHLPAGARPHREGNLVNTGQHWDNCQPAELDRSCSLSRAATSGIISTLTLSESIHRTHRRASRVCTLFSLSAALEDTKVP
eukprot:8029190-Pyramimonas_sp.AAC.1